MLIRLEDGGKPERVAPPELLLLLRWLQRHVRHMGLGPGATGDLHVDLSGALLAPCVLSMRGRCEGGYALWSLA